MIAGFVGRGARYVIVKPPASACAVNEMPEIVVAIGTLANDAAGLFVLPSGVHIDPRSGIERRNHDIGGLAVAFGMIAIACAFEADIAECARQRSVAERYKGWMVHRCLPRNSLRFRYSAFACVLEQTLDREWNEWQQERDGGAFEGAAE